MEITSPAAINEMADGDATPEYARYTVRVPKSAKDLALDKTEHGEMSEKIRLLFQSVAFGEELGQRSQLEHEIASIREKKDMISQEIRELQAKKENLEQRERRLENEISSLSTKEDKFEGALEMLEENLYSGSHVFPEHGGVKKAAALSDIEPEGVIKQLKERNPGIPDYAFQSKMHSRRDWTGCDPEDAKKDE